MRHGQTLTLEEVKGEVRAALAARRLTQADGAKLAKVSRTYFNRALNADKYDETLLAVLNTFLRNVTGYVVEPEVTYRARKED